MIHTSPEFVNGCRAAVLEVLSSNEFVGLNSTVVPSWLSFPLYDGVPRAASLECCSRMSSSVNAGKGSVPSRGDTAALVRLGPLILSSWLVREPARWRWCSSFQPSEPNEPVRISFRDGAFDAVVPVAAHMPGGGLASMSFMLAVRILFVVDVMEALVDVLWRRVPVGESVGRAVESGLRIPSGCGKGTGVGVGVEDAMFVCEWLGLGDCALLCESPSFCSVCVGQAR